MRKDFLPFHVPDIADDEIQSVVETLRSGWLTMGPKVKQFEQEFAKYIGARQIYKPVRNLELRLRIRGESVQCQKTDILTLTEGTFLSFRKENGDY